MQESHGEGVATHTGPESGAVAGDGGREAMIGVVQAGYRAAKTGYFGTPTLWG